MDPINFRLPTRFSIARCYRLASAISVTLALVVLAACDKATSSNTAAEKGDTAVSAATPILDWVNADPWDTGKFEQPIHVYLTTATTGAEIHYTLDGSYPTAISPKVGDAGIFVDSTRTINAIATRPDRTNSALFRQLFKVEPKPAKIDSINGNALYPGDQYAYPFDAPQVVKLHTPTKGAVIHYTLDGSAPNRNSSTYPENGIHIDSSCYLRTVVVLGKTVSLDSNAEKWFDLRAQQVGITSLKSVYQSWPLIPQETWAPFPVVMNSPTKGTVIRYTTDGQIPTIHSPLYSDTVYFDKYADTLIYTAVAFDTANPRIAPSYPTQAKWGTSLPWNKDSKYAEITDVRDGQRYRTIRIGSQNWMAENLNFATDSSVCYNNEKLNCLRFGRYYSWRETMGSGSMSDTATPAGHQGICPTGWHIPNAAEWNELIYPNGQSSPSVERLEARSMWPASRAATDSTGFRILPVGEYSTSSFDKFYQFQSMAAFWSASIGSYSMGTLWEFPSESSYGPAVRLTDNYWADKASLRCIENPK